MSLDSLNEPRMHSPRNHSPRNHSFFNKPTRRREKIETIQAWILGYYNPGKTPEGVWSATFMDKDKNISSLYGSEKTTDKNRVHLVPLLELLEWIKSEKKINLIVYSDSLYVVNCVKEWMDKWKRNDFLVGETNELRPNADILKRINELKSSIIIDIKLLMTENEFSKNARELYQKELR